jgi:hypothetical protein
MTAMARRILSGRRLLTVTAIALTTVLVAGACGGDDEADLALVSYFASVRDSAAQFRASTANLPVASGTGTLEDARAFFEGTNGALRERFEALQALAAPAEVDEAHGRLLESVSAFLDLNERIAGRVGELTDIAGLAAVAQDPELGIATQLAAGDRVTEACRELAEIADAENVDVTLDCDFART